MNEESLLNLLNSSEEYEDALDILHPEDKIELDSTQIKSLNFESSSKMAIVVGHTNRSPGAKGIEPIGMNEYFWNKQLADYIQSIANENEIDCKVFFRDGIGISGAYKQVEKWSPDTCIELHFNAFNQTVKGTETLYGVYSKSKTFAQTIQTNMVNLFNREGIDKRGIKLRKVGERGGKSVNSLKNIPSCLIEPYFGDEPSEAVLALNHINDLANSIVEGHQDYLANN